MPIHPFKDIIGQNRAKDLLLKAVRRNRLSHAYLFKGPPGVGKKLTALTFAAYVNCRSADHEDLCGHCPSCMKFQSGNHPDLHLIKADGAYIKINQVRELRHTLSFPPFEDGYRVVIINDIHAMRRETSNSLLKILEEPPDDTLLILTSHGGAGILPTIVSRCQVVPFSPLPYDLLTRALVDRHGLTPETASTLSTLAEGSFGRAEFIMKKDLLTMRRRIVEALLQFPPDHPETVTAIFALAESAARLKEDLHELLWLLRTWLRDLILAGAGAPDLLLVNRDLFSCFRPTGQRWNPSRLKDKLGMIDRAERQLVRNCNRTLVCEVLFFALL